MTRKSSKRTILANATTALLTLSVASSVSASGMKRELASSHHHHHFAKREFALTTRDQLFKSYDYVIVGGGLAGLVLASRLSEDSSRTVLVLEAGLSGDARKGDIDAPAMAYYASILGSEYDWQHWTTNQPSMNNRVIGWPRGKILGGSTAMNAMYLVRPSKIELDAWSTLLASDPDTARYAKEWGWDTMFDYMKKSENFTGPSPGALEVGNQFSFSAENHGSGGPMQLGYPEVMISANGNWTTALDQVGVPPNQDVNGGVTLGGFISPSSINPRNYTRSYSRSAYIDSLPPRQNLHIITQATVTKLGFSDKKHSNNDEANQIIANSVEFGDNTPGGDEARYVVGVDREVILAGGPLGSPKVLMHSGVGPKDVLEDAGVSVVHELPGVGQHLQDHITAGIVWEATVETAGDIRATGSEFANSSEFLSFINDAVGFANITRLFGENNEGLRNEIRDIYANLTTADAPVNASDPNALTLDRLVPGASPEVLEGYKVTYNITVDQFWEETAHIEFLMSLISPGTIAIQSALQHPFSRGRVYINSTNPFDPIHIDPNYFSHPVDRTIVRQGVRVVREIGARLREMGIVGAEMTPGDGVQSDEDLDRWLTNQGASTQFHPAGSCAMLPRKLGGVVNSALKVYGLANVRVVDSSVYPIEFAAHLASTTYGLAEQGADMIKKQAFIVPKDAKADEKNLSGSNDPPAPKKDDGAAERIGAPAAMWVAVVVGVLGALAL